MNILHVIPDLAPASGGPVSAVVGMATAEASLGYTVLIAATDYGLQPKFYTNNVEFKLFTCKFPSWRYSEELSKALPALVKNSDIVHVHTVWQHPTWVAARICQALGKPYILRPCGMLDKWSLSQSALKKKIYLLLLAAPVIRNASALHFTSEEELLNSLVIGKSGGSFVIPNGLPSSAIENLPDKDAFRRRFPELTGKRIVLFLSRLHYKKQPDVVIKAFGNICGINDRLVLVLAGPAEPAYQAELIALANRLNLSGRICFTGMLQGSAVQEAYCAAELFVLPSLQENFGIAVAEAMAASCPVVVSEQVNLASDIRESKAGIVCESNVASTAAAMEQLLENQKLREEMGENGRNLVTRKFTWVQVADSLLEVYENIITSKRTCSAWKS